jgi:hypothetical protein
MEAGMKSVVLNIYEERRSSFARRTDEILTTIRGRLETWELFCVNKENIQIAQSLARNVHAHLKYSHQNDDVFDQYWRKKMGSRSVDQSEWQRFKALGITVGELLHEVDSALLRDGTMNQVILL